MKYIFSPIVFLISAFCIKEMSCDKLRRGKYLASFDKQHKGKYQRFELTINDTTASVKVDYSTDVYRMQRISECNFWLTNLHPVDTSKLNTFQKQLQSLGEPYYDIQIINSDTLKFVYRVNLHIMIASGIFVKIK